MRSYIRRGQVKGEGALSEHLHCLEFSALAPFVFAVGMDWTWCVGWKRWVRCCCVGCFDCAVVAIIVAALLALKLLVESACCLPLSGMIGEESFVGVDVVIVATVLSTGEGVGDLEDCFLAAIYLEAVEGGKESPVSS